MLNFLPCSNFRLHRCMALVRPWSIIVRFSDMTDLNNILNCHFHFILDGLNDLSMYFFFYSWKHSLFTYSFAYIVVLFSINTNFKNILIKFSISFHFYSDQSKLAWKKSTMLNSKKHLTMPNFGAVTGWQLKHVMTKCYPIW